MQDPIFLILCIVVTGFIGWNVLYRLSGRKFNSLYIAEKLGLSCLLGFGVITLQMFIMSLFGMGFTRLGILLPWAFVVGFSVMTCCSTNRFRVRDATRPGRNASRTRNAVAEVILIALIALQTCYNFFRALIKPIEAYDAVGIYGLKAKIVYLAGGIGEGFFNSIASNFHGAHADYPLLIPLSQAWVYTFLGNFNDFLVKAIFPLFYLSFLLIFYAAVKRITKKRTLSLLLTFALASIKQFSDYSTIGVADLALGIYFSIGIFYLYQWFRSKEEAHFLSISLLSSVLCLWTKNEGALLVLILLSVFLLYMIMNRRKIEKKEILRASIYALVVLLVIFSWGILKNQKTLVNENFNLSMLNLHNLRASLIKLPAVLYEYQKQVFGFKKWNIIWILFAFLLVKEFKRAFSGNIKYVTLTFFLFLAGYTLVYMLSAVPIDFFLRKTFSRFLLHILPVAVFWMGIVLNGKRGLTPLTK